jgi:hypothetical protein
MKIYTLVFLCLSFAVLAQDGLSLQLSTLTGTNISHAQKRNVAEKLHAGISLDISKMTFGKKYWQFDHGYPQMGLLFGFQTLGNNKVYGNAFSLLPYLEFNVYRFKSGVFQIKHGTGVAWVTKRYEKDSENTLHSTNLNATSILDGGFRFNLSGRNDLKIGGILRHISNGGFQKPNSGSNTASAYVNYTHYIQTKPAGRLSYPSPADLERWRFRFMFSPGLHKKPGEQGIAFVPQVSAMTFYQHNTSFRTGAGLEAGIPFQLKPQLSVYLEEEVQFSHMVTRYGFGVYTVNRRNDRETLYSKVGIAYYPEIRNHIPGGFFIGMLLKAHSFVAAHIEINTGYTF